MKKSTLLQQIQRLEAERKSSLNENFLIKLESRIAYLRLLKEVLNSESHLALQQELSVEDCRHIKDYLAHRAGIIEGTPASFENSANSLANVISQMLAIQLQLITGEPFEHLLKPPPQDGQDKWEVLQSHKLSPRQHSELDEWELVQTGEEANKTIFDRRLLNALFLDEKSRLALMDELSEFPDVWKDCIDQLESSAVLAFFTGSLSATFDDIKNQSQSDKIKEYSEQTYVYSERVNRLLLYFLFEIYKRERFALPTYNCDNCGSLGSSILGYASATFGFFTTNVVKVYSREEKIAAARAMQDYLLGKESLNNIEQAMASPNHPLHEHAGALTDNNGDLQSCLEHVRGAARTADNRKGHAPRSYSTNDLSQIRSPGLFQIRVTKVELPQRPNAAELPSMPNASLRAELKHSR